MTDQELLELAAKAADITYHKYDGEFWIPKDAELQRQWDPLANDGDALRLAVKLGLIVQCNTNSANCGKWFPLTRITETNPNDLASATRRAIVRAAAEIGRDMK